MFKGNGVVVIITSRLCEIIMNTTNSAETNFEEWAVATGASVDAMTLV